MTPDCALRAYLDHLIAGGTPATTLRLRRQHLRKLTADTGDLLGLTAEQLVGWGAAHPACGTRWRSSPGSDPSVQVRLRGRVLRI